MRWLNVVKRVGRRALSYQGLFDVLIFVSLILGLILYQAASASAPRRKSPNPFGDLPRSLPNPLEEPQANFSLELLDSYPPDSDGDGIPDDQDNCPNDANADQEDSDGDGQGDVCDNCPSDPDNDADGDGICGDVDNCPNEANPGQEDGDGDGIGDVCDAPPEPVGGVVVPVDRLELLAPWVGLAALAALAVLAVALIRRHRG